MSVMSIKEAKGFNVTEDRRRYYVKSNVVKNNYAPPQEADVWLEMQGENGVLGKAKLYAVSDNEKEETIHAIVQKVISDAANGKEHSKTAFSKEYAGKDGLFKIGDQGLRGLIEVALEKSLLILVKPKEPIKNVIEVLAVPEVTGIAGPDFTNTTFDDQL